jgi:hypothetical protein
MKAFFLSRDFVRLINSVDSPRLAVLCKMTLRCIFLLHILSSSQQSLISRWPHYCNTTLCPNASPSVGVIYHCELQDSILASRLDLGYLTIWSPMTKKVYETAEICEEWYIPVLNRNVEAVHDLFNRCGVVPPMQVQDANAAGL